MIREDRFAFSTEMGPFGGAIVQRLPAWTREESCIFYRDFTSFSFGIYIEMRGLSVRTEGVYIEMEGLPFWTDRYIHRDYGTTCPDRYIGMLTIFLLLTHTHADIFVVLSQRHDGSKSKHVLNEKTHQYITTPFS